MDLPPLDLSKFWGVTLRPDILLIWFNDIWSAETVLQPPKDWSTINVDIPTCKESLLDWYSKKY